MSLSLKASSDGLSLDLLLGATLIATFSTTGIDAGVLIASDAEAQGFANLKKLITPEKLAKAFQGANQGLSDNGYQRLPGGLILQWGSVAPIASGSTANVTLPIAFPNANLYSNTIAVGIPTVGSNTNTAMDAKTLTSIRFVNRYLNTLPFNWFSIGY